MNLTHIRILVSLEISDLGVFIFLNIAVFVAKITDLILENKMLTKLHQGFIRRGPFEVVKMIQTHQQYWRCGPRKLGQGWGRAGKEVANFRLLPKFYLYLK